MPTNPRATVRPWTAALLLVLVAGAPPTLASSRDWDREEVDRWSFEVGVQPELVVDLHDADVEIREGAPRRIEVVVELASSDLQRARERYADTGLSAAATPTGVEIRSERERSRRGWIRGFGWNVTVKVTAPSGFDLDARTGDGDIRIDGIDGRLRALTGDGDIDVGRASSEELSLRTGDGDIAARRLTARNAVISTGDGDVTVDGLEVFEASLSSGDGDLELVGVLGRVDLRTGDGDVRVAFDRFDGGSFSSGDGDVRIELPLGAGADLDLEGEDVSLRGAEARFDGRRSSDRVRGSLDGGGPPLRARSGDGSVSVRVR